VVTSAVGTEVSARAEGLRVRASKRSGPEEQREEIRPSAKQWQNFRTTLDRRNRVAINCQRRPKSRPLRLNENENNRR
jgi:hypothetical protein